MLQFVGHSIKLYEEIDQESLGAFGMNRPGYVFFSSKPSDIERYKAESQLCETLGAGKARWHSTKDLMGYTTSTSTEPKKEMDGIDVIEVGDGPYLFQPNWPLMKEGLVVAKHVRNCGWIYVQRYIDWINQQSRKSGVKFIQDTVKSAYLESSKQGGSGKVSVTFGKFPSTQEFDQIVLALGSKVNTWIKRSGASIGPDGSEIQNLTLLDRPLPSFKLILEIHAKVIFRDPLKIIPRGAPLCLFDDAVTLEWSDQQRLWIESQPHLRYLLEPFKGGVHFRPLGEDDELVGIWTYNLDVEDGFDGFPDHPSIDEYYGEIVVRGLSHFIPALKAYVGTSENPISRANPFISNVKAGYYCKTAENRPFIGPAWQEDPRVLLMGCLSGFGIMSAPGAGEIIASYVINQASGASAPMALPSYAREFLPSRYTDDEYLAKLQKLAGNSGQL
jgi:glycine/D-amino acid oxidase-like deaminating enzyme